MLRNTVLQLSDDTLVNYVFTVTGLGSFAKEFGNAVKLPFHGLSIGVLSLKSIRKSKLAIGRPKDLVHVHQIESTLRMKRAK